MKKAVLSIIVVLLSGAVGCAWPKAARDSEPKEQHHEFRIKSLRDLTQSELLDITKHADTQDVYIIVHPSYYVFFHKKPYSLKPTSEKHAVQCFLDDTRVEDDSLLSLLRIYERAEMDFISTASASGRLVVLLIPGNYDDSSLYARAFESDEYARYINEVTQDSSTVFYIETRRFDTGKILSDDLKILLNFLMTINAQNVLLGGGYIGRCQEEFYQTLTRQWPSENVALIPELSAMSPDDISESMARMLLTSQDELNVWAVNYFIRNGGLKSLQSRMKIRNLFKAGNSNM